MALAAQDRLIATGGVSEIEGSAGGGLTPWALIAGLGTEDQLGVTAHCTDLRPRHFALDECGAALGIRNRVELSVDRMRFGLGDVAPGRDIWQTVLGLKLRIAGDAVYDQDRPWPQLSAGLQWKKNDSYDFIPRLIGARRAQDTDFYLSATKVWLAGPLSRTWLLSATARATRADQFGLLGFGGDRGDAYRLMGEGSAAVFLADRVLLGAEYRQKPDLLRAFREQDAWDTFVAIFPGKPVALTLAWVSLGNIATHPDLGGVYASLQGSF